MLHLFDNKNVKRWLHFHNMSYGLKTVHESKFIPRQNITTVHYVLCKGALNQTYNCSSLVHAAQSSVLDREAL